MNPKSDLYKFLTTAIKYRKKMKIWSLDYTERLIDDNILAFSRGKVLIVTTNSNDAKLTRYITYLPYSEGTTVCNIFYPADCVTVTGGKLEIDLLNGETKVFVPKGDI